MAEAFLKTLYQNRFEAASAGVEPTQVNPYAIDVMKEVGIDLSSYRSKSIEEFRGQVFDYVVTVCDQAQEKCPFFPGKTVLHQGFRDPAVVQGPFEETMTVFQQVRDEIQTWITKTFGADDVHSQVQEFTVEVSAWKKSSALGENQ